MNEEQDIKQRYKCECPCGNIFYATKSIAQESGYLDKGFGSCPKCKIFYNLIVNEDTKKMELTPWDEYIEKMKLMPWDKYRKGADSDEELV